MSTSYPTAEETARRFLLYKLGLILGATTYDKLGEQEPGAWPEPYLDVNELFFLKNHLGVEWNEEDPDNNSIIALLGADLVAMNEANIGLELVQGKGGGSYISFVSLA